MKIAIVTSRYPSSKKPYNHMFVHVRALEFIKQNYQVKVFVPSEINSSTVHEGVSVHRATAKEIIKDLSYYDISYLHLVNLYPFKKSNGWVIYKHLINNKNPFTIYIHGNEVQKYTSRMYEYNFSIIETLKWIKKDFYVIPKMKRFVYKTTKNSNNTFIFPSMWMKEEAERNLKIQFKHNFSIIPTGIETDFFKQVNTVGNKYKLITIRSLSKNVYNIEKTIRVMALLPKKYTLDIYGEGIFLKNYNSLISKLNLVDRVKIIPRFFNKQEMREVFKKYGIYISTTRMDSQGVNMMEAMAAGLLVVTTKNSSKEEYIQNFENGILAITDQSLADAIQKVVEDDNTFKQIVNSGRKSIEKINITTTIGRELLVLKNIMDKRC